MNWKILVSLLVIGLSAIVIRGAMTGAFFSDTETSTGNTFAAAAVFPSVCGNNVVEAGEQCDEGANNGVVCTPSYGGSCNYCSSSCITTTVTGPYCGDGVVTTPPETCDGNSQSCEINGYTGTQACNADCLGWAACITDQPAHLIVIKHVINDNGGTKVAGDFTTTITGVTTANPTASGVESPGVDNTLTTVGSYSVDEGAHAGYDKTLSSDCSGTIALGQTKTCTITNDDQRATLFFDGFGTGATDDTFDEAPAWIEGGQFGAAKQASDITTVSPDGGRFAAIRGKDGYICRTMDTTGYNTVKLSYYWRGVGATQSTDVGIIEFKASGSCTDGPDGTGWTQLQSHNLQSSTGWLAQSPFGNAGFESTTFLLRFRIKSQAASPYFRVDAVTLTGIAN